jgi:hypothetical protein
MTDFCLTEICIVISFTTTDEANEIAKLIMGTLGIF